MAATFIFWLVILSGLVALRIFGGRPAIVTLLEYQRAVLYRRGLPEVEIGKGRHNVFTGIEKLIIVDTRPIHVSYENQCVALRDSSSAVYGISGNARVQDAWKALYSASNFSHVPSYVLLCCARQVLNGCTSMQLKTNKDSVVEQIISLSKHRLAASGFELLSFRMSQCTVTERIFD
jgi:hypothetical protein